MKKEVSGFSKLSKSEKIQWITESFFKDPNKATVTTNGITSINFKKSMMSSLKTHSLTFICLWV